MRHHLATKRAAPILAVLSLLAAASCERSVISESQSKWGFGTSSRELQAGGDIRSYVLHVPASRPRNRLRRRTDFPLVVLLHGSGAEGETIRKQSNFDSLADIYHVVVAYPDGSSGLFGIGSDWNAGECCGTAARQNVDDVGFIRGVIADVSSHLAIDPRRIYVAGFSDGGRMAYRFACVAAGEVAAIGVVSGSLADAHCHPSVPVPLAILHGTADTEVPYFDKAESTPALLPAELTPLPPSVRFWAVENRCSGLQARVIAPTVTRTFFLSCLGAEVSFYAINGGTHSWPGGKKDGPDGQVPSPQLDASGMLMRFFLSHSR